MRRPIRFSESVETIHGMEFNVIKIDPGDHVVCDLCNEDYIDSDEKGGFLFESKAVCPKCGPNFEASAKQHNEEKYIVARANEGESFRDFVYRIRKGDEDGAQSSIDVG